MNPDPSKIVIVPLSVDAMCLGPADVAKTRLAGAYADFSRLTPREYRNSSVSHLPERLVTEADLGVHLQWSLPAPLNSGHAKEGAEATFPPVPNRWLVVRLPFNDRTIATEAWVIESDYCSFEPQWDGTSVPTDTTTRHGHAYLGRSVRLADWTPRDEAQTCAAQLGWKLTAVGWGDPFFSGYYPSCRNVFGFHDRLAYGTKNPAPETKLTYSVVGWYANPADDILTNQSKLREALPWALAHRTADDLKAATTSVYHGFITRVDPVPAASPPGGKRTVAMGNSTQEALSALVASAGGGAEARPGARFEIERQANLLLGHLDKAVPAVDRLTSHLDDKLHELRFLSSHGGTILSVRLKPKNEEQRKADEDEVPPPESLVSAVADYNAAQRELDYSTRLWLALRRRIRDNLSLLEEMIWDPKSQVTNQARRSDIRGSLRARHEKDLAEIFQVDLVRLEAEVAQAKAIAKAELASINASSANEYEIVEIPAPRFWSPRDPILLIEDSGIRSGPRYGARKSLPLLKESEFPKGLPDAFLRCVLARDFSDLNKYSSFYNQRNQLWNFPRHHLPFGDFFGALVGQTFRIIAGGDKVEPGCEYDATGGWRPAYVRWQANYHPAPCSPDAGERYAHDALHGTWDFFPPNTPHLSNTPSDNFDHAELHLRKGAAPRGILRLEGITAMETLSTSDLYLQLKAQAGAGESGKEISAALDAIQHHHLATSVLSGLHDQLIMYKPGFNLPFADRARLLHLPDIPVWLRQNYPGDDVCPDATAEEFSPLRAGRLHLTSLEIIDTFGRIKTVPLSEARRILATSLTPPQGQTADYVAELPPRLCMEARLAFRMIANGAAATPQNPDERSPVCGWVIPSHLEKGLIFCTQEGNMAGLLRHRDGPGGHEFIPAPGLQRTDLHPRLDEMIGALLPLHSPLKQFLTALQNEIDNIVPDFRPTDANMGQLMGRPLAVVHAEIGIDLKGDLPPRRQTLDGSRDDAGLLNIEVPVLLGDPDRKNDGLAAFFLGQNGTFDFAKPWTPTGNLTRSEQRHPLLKLAGYGRDHRQRILMLVDPMAPFHATTGLFPVKSLVLPPRYYKQAREKLGVLFPCGPLLLADPEAWTLPLQPVEDQLWHWAPFDPSKDKDPWTPVAPTTPLPAFTNLPEAKAVKPRIWLTLRPNPLQPSPSPENAPIKP